MSSALSELIRSEAITLILSTVAITYNRKFVLFEIDDNISVSKANWNEKSGRVRKSDNFELINRILAKRENELVSKILSLMEQGKEPTLLNVRGEYFKARSVFNAQSKKPKKEDEKRFLKDFLAFIEDKPHRVNSHGSPGNSVYWPSINSSNGWTAILRQAFPSPFCRTGLSKAGKKQLAAKHLGFKIA